MLGNLWSPVSAENANQPQGSLLGGGASLAGGYSLGNNAAGQGSAYQGQQQPFETIYRLPQTNAAGQPQQAQQQPLGQAGGNMYPGQQTGGPDPYIPMGANPPTIDGTVGGNMKPGPFDAAGRPLLQQQPGNQNPGGMTGGNMSPGGQQGSLTELGKTITNGVQQGMQQYAPLLTMGQPDYGF